MPLDDAVRAWIERWVRLAVQRVDGALAERIDPAAALNRYAVGTRYPGRYANVTREQAEAAVAIAESVRAAILPHLDPGEGPAAGTLRERLHRRRRPDGGP